MKFISVILLLAALTIPAKEQPSYLVIKGKSITINGNTSIGGFNCGYTLSGQNDTLFIKKLSSQPYSFAIPVKEISCGNFILNRDFQTTLRSKEYPKAEVQVLSLEEKKQETLSGNIKLTLVGKSKIIEDVGFFWSESKDNLILNADLIFLSSEFDLTPPRKLGGMIKTDDAMHIQVALTLEPIF